MNSEYYDARLLAYQILISIPSEVLMLDIYNKLEQKSPTSHFAMGLLNAGSTLATLSISKGLYNIFHSRQENRQLTSNDSMYLSPFTQSIYARNEETIDTLPLRKQAEARNKLNRSLEQENSYSKGYMDFATSTYAAKSAFSAYNSPYTSNLAKLAYGLTQPLSVVYKDADMLK